MPHSTVANPQAPSMCSTTKSSLQHARKLQLPSREEMLIRHPNVYDFWNRNESLLEQAWEEWNKEEGVHLPKLDASIFNPELRAAVEAAWADPSVENETRIKNLWQEVSPGVYAVQFFDLDQVHKLRQWFDATAAAGIPVRPPYGIVLNRKGAMTDPRSVGYLAAPDFQSFYQMLVDEYIRPLGRMFFPDEISTSDDDESFSFSIQYQGEQGGDKSIRRHSDASTLTFNLNFDESKTWSGSSLIFYEHGKQYEVEWKPGFAVMHLGRSMHAALPIETGTRSNWVIWTMGSRGYYSYGASIENENGGYSTNSQTSLKERWTKMDRSKINNKLVDRWSPF